MFQKYILIYFILFFSFALAAQDVSINSKKLDSLKYVLATTKEDSTRIHVLGGIGFSYQVINIDSALKYAQAGVNLAREKGDFKNEAYILATLSGIVSQQGKFAEALDLLFRSLKIAKDNNLTYDIARAYRRLGGVYFDLENYPKAIGYGLAALKLDEENKYKSAATDHISLANAYEKMGNLDSALFYADAAIGKSDFLKDLVQTAYRIAGDIKIKRGNYQQADSFLRKGLTLSQNSSDFLTVSEIYCSMANMFMKQGKKDSALFYALKGFEYGKKVSSKKGIIVAGTQLAELYDSTDPSLALKYYRMVAAEKDSLFGVANIQTIQNLITHEEEKQKELEKERESYRNRVRLYGLLTGLLALLVIAFILYRNNRQKQKANKVLQQQKEKIETTLTELKSTQAQLIQSEKMASLGELTAGIAHEIQNPLNFVNNFSEVNTELIDELQQEMDKGNLVDARAISNDIKDNEQKISHHGKRADAIVKGMLQHSRSSNGAKEPTDLNALADEYLRLAYHGLRAKDKSFNATLKTDYDDSIGNIDIVSQDIGRVILNLITNAFYAASLSSKGGSSDSADRHDPTVWVGTKKAGNKVFISVKDNGPGIPQKILDKIFQPFFTTKPTGQGTGLGLSLSYDIIKAHGGELKVNTKENEYAEFIIILPQ